MMSYNSFTNFIYRHAKGMRSIYDVEAQDCFNTQIATANH